MIFQKTKLNDVHIVKLEPLTDERGFFARSWCKQEFSDQGLANDCVQTNLSFNKTKGTLRGMHYQAKPHGEVKLVRCIKGAIYDVVIDLREQSSTYLKWLGVELNDENRDMLYIPKGFAHGFLTLKDNVEVFYQMSEFYKPDAARGLRYDDPTFNIHWPTAVKEIAEKDRAWPDFHC
jgi:dTDP-4-dehydrorhamnose 3,5-epimerase